MRVMKWSELTHFQLGKYAEYFVKMEFIKAGFDVYTTEIDNKGIDFVVKSNDKYFDIQVKSVRDKNYVYMKKKYFSPRKNLLLALVLFEDEKSPVLLLIPSLEWKNKTHSFLVDRNYEGKKSEPEWGININNSNIEKIKSLYAFDKQIKLLLK